MASPESDDTPMLQGISGRNRSASFSTPVIPSHYEPNLVGFTGPLRIQRNIQMTGPLYPRPKAADPKREGYTPNETNDTTKNEHLLRSGQLGVCNDPYCTTCPIFYNVHKPSPTTSEFDAKVLTSCLCSPLNFELMLYSAAF